jgi:hypothetical protein
VDVGAHRIEYRQGYPVLIVQIDGVQATIPFEQKAHADGLIYLGMDFETRVAATLPAAPNNGRHEAQVLRGFTDDERVLRLYDRFRDTVEAAPSGRE